MASSFLDHLLHTESGIIDILPENTEINSDLVRRLLKNGNETNLSLRRLFTRNYLQDSDKREILNAHNLYRAKTARSETPNQPGASDMNEIFWDSALAKVAEDYSRKCIFEHNANRAIDLKKLSSMASWDFEPTVNVGENLYLTTRAESLDALLAGLEAFYTEYQYYSFSNNQCQSGQICGHYKQLVTSRSRYVGCGYTFCESAYYPAGNHYYQNALILTCNYSPPSNSVPYTKGVPCSQCSSDRQCKDQAVCGGCPNKYYLSCLDSSTSCTQNVAMCPNDCTFDSTNIVCQQCSTTCKTCEHENIDITSQSLSCSNGISDYFFNSDQTISLPTPKPTLKPTEQITQRPTLLLTLKPTLLPTLKPTLLPTQSPTYQYEINENYCCHAYVPDDYEQRCNLLISENTCLYFKYNDICYWQASTKCQHSLPKKLNTHYYCTALNFGSRKKAVCETFFNEAECQYNGCKWSAME